MPSKHPKGKTIKIYLFSEAQRALKKDIERLTIIKYLHSTLESGKGEKCNSRNYFINIGGKSIFGYCSIALGVQCTFGK